MIGDVPRREQMSPAAAQAGVISALFIREMLTRVGRSRLGILWLMAEPIILSSMISLLHWATRSELPNGLPVFLFYALSYVPFMMFRSIVNRGSSGIQANISLLHHRRITLLDVMVARNLMEMMVCATVIALYMVIATLFLGEPPHAPALFVFGLALSALLANGLAMVLGSAQVVWEWIEHLVHPFTYLMLPISAAFFMLDMMPQETRELLLWNPLVHVHEMNRWAQFGDRVTPYYDISYVLLWIVLLNLLGMAGLRVARSRLSMSD
ncbi:ABC transporter permease [Roseomonas sp. E05]|uniref:ABC transporter permease n=1 Tax=Roseomonas sp. E05 TaxID=3046310 RepID=UPI0024B8E33D|nr:ABC transporter permease [Roseomonas sp. E05]MDJ0389786.1 ABC transporter permease [Roseomonas sp. E05]